MEKGSGAGRTGAFVRRAKRLACQEWDSNPCLQGRLQPERRALDHSAMAYFKIFLFFKIFIIWFLANTCFGLDFVCVWSLSC